VQGPGRACCGDWRKHDSGGAQQEQKYDNAGQSAAQHGGTACDHLGTGLSAFASAMLSASDCRSRGHRDVEVVWWSQSTRPHQSTDAPPVSRGSVWADHHVGLPAASNTTRPASRRTMPSGRRTFAPGDLCDSLAWEERCASATWALLPLPRCDSAGATIGALAWLPRFDQTTTLLSLARGLVISTGSSELLARLLERAVLALPGPSASSRRRFELRDARAAPGGERCSAGLRRSCVDCRRV
jgi:hypothetical protein